MKNAILGRAALVLLTFGLLLGVSESSNAGVKKKLLGGKGKDADKVAQAALDAGRYREALDLYREILKVNPDWNASRAVAHFSLALLHSSPKTGFRNIELAGRLLRSLDRSYPTFQPAIQLSSLLSLTEDLVQVNQDLAEAEQQRALMKKAVDSSNAQAVTKSTKRELVADSATLALQARVGTLEKELLEAQGGLAKAEAETANLLDQLLQREEALKRVTEALVGGG